MIQLEFGQSYENSLGAVLVIDGPYMGRRPASLGGIYTAHVLDSLFGAQPYLVTPASMEECGYRLVPASTTGSTEP